MKVLKCFSFFLLFFISCKKNHNLIIIDKIELEKNNIILLKDRVNYSYSLKYKNKKIDVIYFETNETAMKGNLKMYKFDNDSFILQYIAKDYSIFTFNKINNDSLIVYNYFEIINTDNKIVKESMCMNDTISKLNYENINIPADILYTNLIKLKKQKFRNNYLLRKQKWTSTPITNEEIWIMTNKKSTN